MGRLRRDYGGTRTRYGGGERGHRGRPDDSYLAAASQRFQRIPLALMHFLGHRAERHRRTRAKQDENTKRIRREYDENTKTTPGYVASSWLYPRFTRALPWLYSGFTLACLKLASRCASWSYGPGGAAPVAGLSGANILLTIFMPMRIICIRLVWYWPKVFN